ncbi:MAG: hypothetical protein ACRDHZ_00295 [Ktedonobacteraceae bacterium]
MARRLSRIEVTQEKTLTILNEHCEQCGQLLWVAGHNHRTIVTLSGTWKLTLVIRQCIQLGCPSYQCRQHPEEEGSWALPHGEIGLDVIVLIGAWHFRRNCSASEIYRELQARGINIAQRSVTYLIRRYEKLVKWPDERIKIKLQQLGQVILVIDELQPEASLPPGIMYETLWVVRDSLSREILLARLGNLRYLLNDVKYCLRQLKVSVKSLIFNGEGMISSEIAIVFPDVPCKLCQFHQFKNTTGPLAEQTDTTTIVK